MYYFVGPLVSYKIEFTHWMNAFRLGTYQFSFDLHLLLFPKCYGAYSHPPIKCVAYSK